MKSVPVPNFVSIGLWLLCYVSSTRQSGKAASPDGIMSLSEHQEFGGKNLKTMKKIM